MRGLDVVANDVARQAPINAFVEKKPSRCGFNQVILSFLQESNNLRPRYGRESFKKIVNRFPRFEVIKQSLHGYSRAMEHCSAAHDVRATGDDWSFHQSKLLREAPERNVVTRTGCNANISHGRIGFSGKKPGA